MKVIKLLGAVVVAAGVAYGSGFVANQAVHSEELAKNAVAIEIPAPVAAAPAQTIVLAEAETAPAEAAADAAAAPAPAAEMSLIDMIKAGDVKHGKKLSRACAACHTFDKGGPNRVGPNQWGVVGREKGYDESFKYSDAIKNFGGTWTYEELDGYLTSPKKFAPGNKMTYAGMKKAQDRADLIAWLRLQSDSPLPLE